jgi:hypothetical protein
MRARAERLRVIINIRAVINSVWLAHLGDDWQ